MPTRTHFRRAALKRWLAVPLLAVAGLAGTTLLVGCGSGDGGNGAAPTTAAPTSAEAPTTTQRESVTHEFVIPEGTAEIVKAGGDPGIIPKQLDVRVGDKIQVRNDDTEIARLGIFDVGAGETMTMTFNQVNVLNGVIFAEDAGGCGSPPPKSKQFIINVRP